MTPPWGHDAMKCVVEVYIPVEQMGQLEINNGENGPNPIQVVLEINSGGNGLVLIISESLIYCCIEVVRNTTSSRALLQMYM